MLIPPGYASVGLEEICDQRFEDLELDIPGGDGEKTLKEAVHAIILWSKRYIIIPGTNAIDSSETSPISRAIISTGIVVACSLTISRTIQFRRCER